MPTRRQVDYVRRDNNTKYFVARPHKRQLSTGFPLSNFRVLRTLQQKLKPFTLLLKSAQFLLSTIDAFTLVAILAIRQQRCRGQRCRSQQHHGNSRPTSQSTQAKSGAAEKGTQQRRRLRSRRDGTRATIRRGVWTSSPAPALHGPYKPQPHLNPLRCATAGCTSLPGLTGLERRSLSGRSLWRPPNLRLLCLRSHRNGET